MEKHQQTKKSKLTIKRNFFGCFHYRPLNLMDHFSNTENCCWCLFSLFWLILMQTVNNTIKTTTTRFGRLKRTKVYQNLVLSVISTSVIHLLLATVLFCTVVNATPSPSPPSLSSTSPSSASIPSPPSSSSSSSSFVHQQHHHHLSEQQKSLLLSSLNQRNIPVETQETQQVLKKLRISETFHQNYPSSSGKSAQSMSQQPAHDPHSRPRRGPTLLTRNNLPNVPNLSATNPDSNRPHYSGPISNVHATLHHHHNRRHTVPTAAQPEPIDPSFVHQLVPSLYDAEHFIDHRSLHAPNVPKQSQYSQQVPTTRRIGLSPFPSSSPPRPEPHRQPIRTKSADSSVSNVKEPGRSGVNQEENSQPEIDPDSIVSESENFSDEFGPDDEATLESLLTAPPPTVSNTKLNEDELLPEGYDKLMPPKENGNPTVVRFHVWVLGLDSIDEGSMTYVADIFMSQSWKDNRLVIPDNITFNVNASADPRGPYRLLPVTLIDKIWRPDSFFKNAKEVTFQEMTIPNHYIWLYSDRTILYMVKLSLLLSCAMKFQSYPHDTQNCTMKIESLSYTTDDLEFDWEQTEPLVVEEHIELPQHDLINQQIDFCTTNYSSGRFACVQVQFTIKRRLGYYIFHTYIPTCLIVIMSWISFWIKPEAVPARVTLCVTSLLTLSTQHAQSQKSLPPVSYIKAIDIFMSSCTVFVFASLMEYALVNILMSDEMLNGWNAVAGPVGGGVCIPPTAPPSKSKKHSSSCSSSAATTTVVPSPKNPSSPKQQNSTVSGTRFRKNVVSTGLENSSDVQHWCPQQQHPSQRRRFHLQRFHQFQSLTELKNLRNKEDEDEVDDEDNDGEEGGDGCDDDEGKDLPDDGATETEINDDESIPEYRSPFVTTSPQSHRRPIVRRNQFRQNRARSDYTPQIPNSLPPFDSQTIETTSTKMKSNITNSMNGAGGDSGPGDPGNIRRIPSWSVIRLLRRNHRNANNNNNNGGLGAGWSRNSGSHHHRGHRPSLTNRQYPLNVHSGLSKPFNGSSTQRTTAAAIPPTSLPNHHNPNVAQFNWAQQFQWDQSMAGYPTASQPGPVPTPASPHSHYLLQQQHHKRAYVVDNVSRWIFPLSFIALNVVYWAYYLELVQSIDDLYQEF